VVDYEPDQLLRVPAAKRILVTRVKDREVPPTATITPGSTVALLVGLGSAGQTLSLKPSGVAELQSCLGMMQRPLTMVFEAPTPDTMARLRAVRTRARQQPQQQ
jgi:hypothetical protein